MAVINLPYYTGHLEIEVAEKNLKAVLSPAVCAIPDGLTQSEIIRQALAGPIGTAPLSELAVGKKRVVIVTSDHTRAMPSQITIPLLLKQIRQGNPEADITILIATGLHRQTSDAEQMLMFGEVIAAKGKIVCHDAYDAEKMRFVGDLPSGASFSVNKLALEADLLVCEGFVEPHFFAGFSGGPKSILPGIASAPTINANHCAAAIAHANSKTGLISGNIIHADMLAAAGRVGVDFILNVALNEQKEIVAAFAGTLEEAHAAACSFVRGRSEVKRVTGDIVVTSNGGYPLDQNLYQSPKAMTTARECAAAGAVIIMVASCADGLGGENFGQMLLSGEPEKILENILSASGRETAPEQWNAQILCDILTRHQVILVSTYLDHELIRQIGMIPASTPDEALRIAYGLKSTAASVVVIPDGVAVMVR